MQQIDPSKKGVLQTGKMDSPSLLKKPAEKRTSAEEKERQVYISVLKTNLEPLPVSMLRDNVKRDRISMENKLNKADLKTLRRFFEDTEPAIVTSILTGGLTELDGKLVAHLQEKYKDISP